MQGGIGEERHSVWDITFEMPIRNPNGNVDLDIQVWSPGERSRLEEKLSAIIVDRVFKTETG